MARRIAGQGSASIFDLQLVGPASPIDPDELPPVARRSADYVKLVSRWGGGWAYGTLELADPRSEVFRCWQERFRLHAAPMSMLGHWKLDDEVRERGVLLAVYRGTGVLATPDAMVALSRTACWPLGSFADVLAWARKFTRKPVSHYITRPSLVSGLLGTDDPAEARRLLEQIRNDESIAGLVRAASALAAAPTSSPEVRAGIVRAAIELARQHDPECLRLDPDTVERTLRRSEPVPALHEAAHPFDLFAAIGDPREDERVAAILANPADPVARAALAQLYEDGGFDEHARLVREQTSAAAPLEDVERHGVMHEDAATCATRMTEWADAWRARDGALPVDAVLAETAAVEPTLARAIVNWILRGSHSRLRAEPRSSPFLILAGHGVELLGERRVKLAQPFLLARLREGLSGDDGEAHAIAYVAIDKLPAVNVPEVLGWLADEARRPIAMCLLQQHGSDERVFAAALAHFVDAHPFSERVIGKRSSEPRVAAALIPLFERADRKSVTKSGHVIYGEQLVVLAKFLAKLKHRRAIEVREQYKLKLQVDGEERSREAARDRRADFGY